jgi:dsRNA-specific ribonuclease
MKRIQVGQLSRQWLATTVRPAPTLSRIITSAGVSRTAPAVSHGQIRCQSAAATPEAIFDEAEETPEEKPNVYEAVTPSTPLPSPHPDRAPRSAKLAALHARLSLSSKIPLQTLARTLVDPSADPHPRFNNANLAYVGSSLLQYHTSEFLITKWPRLPMGIMFGAMRGYIGPTVLHRIARAWGVEAAAAPGEEVDPGYLQYSLDRPTVLMRRFGYSYTDAKRREDFGWNRGKSNRAILDGPFGDNDPGRNEIFGEPPPKKKRWVEDINEHAHANFVCALVGAVNLHCGREAAKTFIQSYMLSRRLDLSNLFTFKLPQLELTRLCAREEFAAPVARLLSETGRLSRTPVFVVGIYSGRDKLGEAAAANLTTAKIAATINALKAWYLYSPGDVGVPSDTLAEDATPWKPVYVDPGEIIS